MATDNPNDEPFDISKSRRELEEQMGDDWAPPKGLGGSLRASGVETSRWYALGAFRGCTAHRAEHGINYNAVTEAHGPGAVQAMIAAGDRAGQLCPATGYHGNGEADNGTGRDCYAVLDVLDVGGDLIADRCIPTRDAFGWWVRAIELRVAGSDCPVDTPEAHAATYALAGAR